MTHEGQLRIGIFLGVLLLMALWETLRPRRTPVLSRRIRWLPNLELIALDTLVVRLLFPTGAVALAAQGQTQGWGLLHSWHGPEWIEGVLAVIALDLVIYLQHVMFHAVPVLWRLHQVHHADLEIDVTTGLRFHPVEIILSMGIKLAAILVIGPSPLAVLIFEVILNAMAMFNHANIRLPERLDQTMRWLIVTPDMHRSHHSSLALESNTNFGFNLALWDRLMGTYCIAPAEGHEGMQIGLAHQRDPERCQPLGAMMRMPFREEIGTYPINRRW
ncbi:MAG: sterol desaturase family protein [Magnetococcales bacterium]|nr:sterol desaturase family protein [Magnetococcales bacterium]